MADRDKSPGFTFRAGQGTMPLTPANQRVIADFQRKLKVSSPGAAERSPSAERQGRGSTPTTGLSPPILTPSSSKVSAATTATPNARKDDLDYAILDVFTRERFKGNPLAVVFDSNQSPLAHGEKQRIAKEFNLSETVFVSANDDQTGPFTWTLDIFTPHEELPFAGHPIVGAACALALKQRTLTQGTFYTQAGPLKFRPQASSTSSNVALARAELLNIPYAVHLHQTRMPAERLKVMQPKLWEADLMHNGYITELECPVFSITKGMTYVLVEVASMEALALVSRSSRAPKAELDKDWAPSFVGTYFYYAAPRFDKSEPVELHTRMIEPDLGEDPVTGSAACTLAAYLALQEAKHDLKLTKMDFNITQGEHMGRKGQPIIQVSLEEGNITKISLKGDAVRVMQGVLER